jgi:hypothetical protein
MEEDLLGEDHGEDHVVGDTTLTLLLILNGHTHHHQHHHLLEDEKHNLHLQRPKEDKKSEREEEFRAQRKCQDPPRWDNHHSLSVHSVQLGLR